MTERHEFTLFDNPRPGATPPACNHGDDMKTLRFTGQSDDTFGETTAPDDHDNSASGDPIVYEISSESEGVALGVVGQYASEDMTDEGVWMVGVIPSNEGGLPDWPVRIVNGDSGYSPVLEVDVPDDAVLELMKG